MDPLSDLLRVVRLDGAYFFAVEAADRWSVETVAARVLTLLHGRPGHPWTLDEVAREAASSRSNVAKRFALLVGQPPMQYLTQWRMQVAANLLA